MNLLLISKTAIIKQIFNLVSSKLDVTLSISDINISHKMFDIIIIEDDLLDDKFPLKEYAKRLGIITKNSHKYANNANFTLPKPFLPSALLEILKEQKDALSKEIEDNKSIIEEDNTLVEDEIDDTIDYIQTLANDITQEIDDENDESIVNGAFVQDGGILDPSELSKIEDILTNTSDNTIIQEDENEADEWMDLSQIIDDAIEEVSVYKFDGKSPIKLILNEFNMNEISPLLNKLDQNIIDSLTNGEEITLKLKVNLDAK